MPFKSESQRRLCYLLKSKGQAGSWDCDEWSTSTGKQELPEHIKDQTEKTSGLSAVKALCALWSNSSPLKEAATRSLLLKLSSVITSPGRGSGDEEATAVNPDSSEGLQMPKPTRPALKKTSFNQNGLKPVAPLGAARNALRRVTEKDLGFDPAGGVKEAQSMVKLWKNIPGTIYRSMFGNGPRVPREKRPKKDWELSDLAEEYPELKTLNFQDLYRKSEQRVLERMAKDQFHGSPESLYAGNMVLSKQADNFDFSSIGTKLDPSLIGGARQAPSMQGVAPARGFDFANMTKSLQNAGRQAGAAAKSGVESWVKAPGFTNPGEVWRRRNQALGAQKSIGSAVDAGGKAISGIQSGAQRIGSGLMSFGDSLMGKQSDVAAQNAVTTPASKNPDPVPVASSNNGNALRGAASGVGDAFRAGFGNQEALKRVQDDLNRPNLSNFNSRFKDFTDRTSNSFNYASKNYKPSFEDKLRFAYSNPRLATDILLNGTKEYTDGFASMNPFASMTPAISHGANALGSYASTLGAQSEGRRMTAGVTMPVLNFMQNNPWAKYLMGAAGVGAAGYGLSRLFGGGQQQGQQPQAGSTFQQSYNQGLLSNNPNYTKTFTPEIKGA